MSGPTREPNWREGEMIDDIPRRIRIDLYTPAETAIREAILAVEEMPADVRLTRAVVLLGEAQGKVADFVDGVSEPATPAAPGERGEPCPQCDDGPLSTDADRPYCQNCGYIAPASTKGAESE